MSPFETLNIALSQFPTLRHHNKKAPVGRGLTALAAAED
jgi:hypothetical protein